MRYCIKRIFILPDTLKKTKEVIAKYYQDIGWFKEDIEESLGEVKTWKDMESYFDEFDADELNDLEEYFEVEYGRKIVEKE